jgi:Uma2 family endonuclease
MPTLVRDPQPAEFEALLERRQRLGQDLMDEVWDGVYVMNPAPAGRHAEVVQQLAEILGAPARAAGLVPMVSIINVGEPDDYRVPDGGLLRGRPGEGGVYLPSAALVIEVVSPTDDTREKVPFYAKRGVEELLIVDPAERRVEWLALQPSSKYGAVERSGLIEVSATELAKRLDWPA